MKARYSTIFIRESNEWVKVRITSINKPEISQKIIEKWQTILDLAAKFIDVPAGLIMQLNEQNIKVFLRSSTEGNPFEKGEESDLKHGLYCETVCGTKRELMIPNALKDSLWMEDNPDLLVDMISYLGVPIRWPDGEIFGSFCVLDNKENSYSDMFREYLTSIRDSVEKDLDILYKAVEIEKKIEELKDAHKVKEKFLSIFYHDVFSNITQVKNSLQELYKHIDEIEPQELKEYLERINTSTRQSHKVLEDVLSWSKEDILNMSVNASMVNLSESIKSIIDSKHQALTLKRIKVFQDLPKEGIVTLIDKNMLETAIRNVLTFTIQFSNIDGIIWVRTKIDKENIHIEIEDNGQGFPKDELDQLFHVKKRKGASNVDSSKAVVELMLAKEFLINNRGKLSVESLEGKGTKFTLLLKV